MLVKDIIKEIMSDAGIAEDDYDSNYDFDELDYLEERDAEEWVSQGKYEDRQVIYWSNKHNCNIAVQESRSGSYFSDYMYTPPVVSVAYPKERQITIVEWYDCPDHLELKQKD